MCLHVHSSTQVLMLYFLCSDECSKYTTSELKERREGQQMLSYLIVTRVGTCRSARSKKTWLIITLCVSGKDPAHATKSNQTHTRVHINTHTLCNYDTFFHIKVCNTVTLLFLQLLLLRWCWSRYFSIENERSDCERDLPLRKTAHSCLSSLYAYFPIC